MSAIRATGAVCAVCGILLDYIDSAGGRQYLHARPDDAADHIVVPVDAADLNQVISRCDFCDTTDPDREQWILPARRFPMVAVDGRRYMSCGGWWACGACAPHVQARNWQHFLDVQLAALPPEHRRHANVAAATLRQLYRNLEAATLGPLVRVERPAP